MSLQNESELEKAEEDILDKVQDCVYGLNLNVGGEEYKEILGQIKNSVWLRGEIQRAIDTAVSNREKEIAEYARKMRDDVDSGTYCNNQDSEWKNGYDCAMYDILSILKHNQ